MHTWLQSQSIIVSNLGTARVGGTLALIIVRLLQSKIIFFFDQIEDKDIIGYIWVIEVKY